MSNKHKIKNVITSIPKEYEGNEVKAYFNYADFITIVCNSKVVEGVTYKEMKIGFDILTEVEKNPTEIKLNDEQIKYLKKRVENFVWTLQHREIYDFCSSIIEL